MICRCRQPSMHERSPDFVRTAPNQIYSSNAMSSPCIPPTDFVRTVRFRLAIHSSWPLQNLVLNHFSFSNSRDERRSNKYLAIKKILDSERIEHTVHAHLVFQSGKINTASNDTTAMSSVPLNISVQMLLPLRYLLQRPRVRLYLRSDSGVYIAVPLWS